MLKPNDNRKGGWQPDGSFLLIEDSLEYSKVALGGEGSGNFGHAGRIGEVGGSAPSSAAVAPDFDEMADAFKRSAPKFAKAEGWTLDSKTGAAITVDFDASSSAHAHNKDIYRLLGGNGKDRVYIVAYTNNEGGIDSTQCRKAWQQHRYERLTMGNWKDTANGKEFNDVGAVLTGRSESEVDSILARENQQSALYIEPDGTVNLQWRKKAAA